jgi:hypothetical protein
LERLRRDVRQGRRPEGVEDDGSVLREHPDDLLEQTRGALGVREARAEEHRIGAGQLLLEQGTGLLAGDGAGVVVGQPGRAALRQRDGDEGDEQVAEAALAVARRFGAVVASNSWIVTSDATWQVTTGDTGLGTSGSGDVVAGATLGLLSRGAGLVQALVWAKYVHAAAGAVLAAGLGGVGALPSEGPPELPLVLGSLRGD